MHIDLVQDLSVLALDRKTEKPSWSLIDIAWKAYNIYLDPLLTAGVDTYKPPSKFKKVVLLKLMNRSFEIEH